MTQKETTCNKEDEENVDVDLEKCFEILYRTLDIMIEEYSKMDGFNYIVNKLKRIKEKIGYIDIDTFDTL